VVIGAGGAGIAAARTLVAAGVSTLLLEARDRLGGRAMTRQAPPCPLDLGCGWLHSGDRNPWCVIADRLGFAVDRSSSPWGRQSRHRRFSEEDRQAYREASDRFFERLELAASSKQDQPGTVAFEPGNRWNPLINGVGTYINGVEYDRVSVLDYHNYADTGVNWRVTEGYGALISAYGADLPVRFGSAVSIVDHSETLLRIATDQGEVRAERAIVAVPSSIIAAERLRFAPELPSKVEAARGLPLGVADKVFLRVLDEDAVPKDGHVLGRPDQTTTGSYLLRPFGRPIIEGYFGGALAIELETGGIDAFGEFALQELAGVFGAEIRKALEPMVSTAWYQDPFSLGSYSHALPFHSGDRSVLAAPVEDRIFFAGEACSRNDFSTAHGAYRTGRRAARELLAAMGRSAQDDEPE
jgi:monoamine oxidase